MPGNGAIYRSWVTGDTLTAADLTTSFTTVGVTNMTPQILDDYSLDATQMQSVVDPYPSAVISLATSTAGELERLRYVMKKGFGLSQWYAHSEMPTKATQAMRGLVLRTGTDGNALTAVSLIKADELVMDDGLRVGSWGGATGPLTATITTAGAAGLDTGAEAASTWYEVYAIRKSSDGTKNLLLHKAKVYTADQSFVTTADGVVGLRNAAGTTNLAQGVKFTNVGKFEFVDVLMAKVGSPTGNMWFTFESDNAGDPSATVLATSIKLDVSMLTTTAQYIRIPFYTPATVAAATQYHLVANGDFAISGSNYVTWSGVIAGGYAGGASKKFDGATWSASGTVLDFDFKLYSTTNDTAITYPSGYDQKCLVGYVYNNSGSDFQRFIANDRYVRTLEDLNTGNFTNTTPVLFTWSVPPVPCKLHLQASADSGTRVIRGGGVPDGYALATTGQGITVSGTLNALTSASAYFGPLNCEFQGVYLLTDAGTGKVWHVGYEW